MGTLEDVNRLAAAGVSEFRIQSFDRGRMMVIGSSDLCYHHAVELTFIDVAHINLPTTFNWPVFADAGRYGDGERRRFTIRAEGSEWEVIAEAAEVVLGTVFHYDRGDQLLPGERVADWVQRKPA